MDSGLATKRWRPGMTEPLVCKTAPTLRDAHLDYDLGGARAKVINFIQTSFVSERMIDLIEAPALSIEAPELERVPM
jgi:hypothetical protein